MSLKMVMLTTPCTAMMIFLALAYFFFRAPSTVGLPGVYGIYSIIEQLVGPIGSHIKVCFLHTGVDAVVLASYII